MSNQYHTIFHCCLAICFICSQGDWRQVQSLGLQKKHQEHKSFNCQVRKLIALTFVPILGVINAFKLIAGECDEAKAFLDYFEKTWIGEPKTRGQSINRKINQSSTSTSRHWPKETAISNRALKCS